MFHTPPINPERSNLSREATLESYSGRQSQSQPQPSSDAPDNHDSATTSANHDTVSIASPVSVDSDESKRNLDDPAAGHLTSTIAPTTATTAASISHHNDVDPLHSTGFAAANGANTTAVPNHANRPVNAAISSSSSSSINIDFNPKPAAAPTTGAAATATATANANAALKNGILDYCREVRLVKLPKELHTLIDGFLKDLQAPKYSQPLSTDQVSLLFQQFYTKFDEHALQYAQKHHPSTSLPSESSNNDKPNTKSDAGLISKLHNDYVEHMEYLLCANKLIYNKIYQNNVDDLKIQVNIYEKVYVLRNIVQITFEQLELDLKQFESSFNEETFKEDLAIVEKSFNRTNHVKSPLEKLTIFSNSFELLVKLTCKYKENGSSSTSSFMTADILIPIFIYFVVHRHVENLFLNFKFIRRFKNNQFWIGDSNNGIYSYNMTNIEALLTFLINLDYKRDLNLSDEVLQKLLQEFQIKRFENNKKSNSRKFKEFKEDKSAEISKLSHINNKSYSEKKSLIEKIDHFNDEDCNITFFDNITLQDLQKILSPFDEVPFFNEATILPPPANGTSSYKNNNVSTTAPKLNGRKKSNSITLLKNTLQESLSHYHNISPSSSSISSVGSNGGGHGGGMRHSSLPVGESGLISPSGRSLTFSDAAQVSSGLVLNVADQGFKNLSSVFDSSIKFLGTRMGNNNSSPNINTIGTSQSTNSLNSLLGNRSRSNSGNSFGNSRNRSNSTLNSVFNSNSISTINENGASAGSATTDQNDTTEATITSNENNNNSNNSNNNANNNNAQHPLNKFMRWRTGSSSALTSPVTSAHSISSTEKPDDSASINLIENANTGTSIIENENFNNNVSGNNNNSNNSNSNNNSNSYNADNIRQNHSRSGSLSLINTLKKNSQKISLLGNANNNNNSNSINNSGNSNSITPIASSSSSTSATITNNSISSMNAGLNSSNSSLQGVGAGPGGATGTTAAKSKVFKKIDKSFNELSIAELHDLYDSYNQLVGILGE